MLRGGQTGAGKTELIQELASAGAQATDLEGLAQHRGSAFGDIGLGDQPTQQNFENRLAHAWATTLPDTPLWLEKESRGIGQITIP